MTTEREYQEGQKRIGKLRRQDQQNTNQFFWIFMGIMVFIGLIAVKFYQTPSPQPLPSDSSQISQ